MIYSHEKLVYRNALGDAIELSPFSIYLLEKFEGREGLENELHTNKSIGQHGRTFIDSTLDMRYISLSGKIKGDNKYLSKQKLTKAFNPNVPGTLIYSNAYLKTDRVIDCKVERTPVINSDTLMWRFNIDLVCPSPFWKEQEKVEHIALLMKKNTYPMNIPSGGMMFGLKKSILETKVVNVGDVKSGFRVVFRAKGTVEKPRIINKLTGQYILLNYNMVKDDLIEVINYPYEKKVTINGSINGFKYLDISSEFFDLEVGDNLIGYLADLNTINLEVVVYYTPQYLGV